MNAIFLPVKSSVLLFAVVTAWPAVAEGQIPTRSLQERRPAIPANMVPPAGKCRIWMDGVAPEQQPAPTDCQTALRQKPANGTVVFGPSEREDGNNAFNARPVAPGRGRPRADSTKTPNARETVRESDRRPPRPDTTRTRRRPEQTS